MLQSRFVCGCADIRQVILVLYALTWFALCSLWSFKKVSCRKWVCWLKLYMCLVGYPPRQYIMHLAPSVCLLGLVYVRTSCSSSFDCVCVYPGLLAGVGGDMVPFDGTEG